MKSGNRVITEASRSRFTCPKCPGKWVKALPTSFRGEAGQCLSPRNVTPRLLFHSSGNCGGNASFLPDSGSGGGGIKTRFKSPSSSLARAFPLKTSLES
ncbi:hypothetical protein CDAR_614971 [Caerostris darwini]|uniref:Uncharacterized protein n=1 Tax=Caerostris darwini TaxID=1538125 RepID=A0AAV4WTH6_9ARAC|nr:hypothetical protein CDAR_614971 [Caerostris darwini]